MAADLIGQLGVPVAAAGLAENLIGHLGYLGIVLLLVLGGLGLPVPEEAPIILAAVLSKKGTMWEPLALGACVVGVLAGDFIVYFLGYFYGERVLRLRLTRKFLTKAREEQIKGYFHRHGVKILIMGRFAVGFRTAAYLTAGILRLPMLKLLLTDLVAVALSTPLMFGLGWLFAKQIEEGLHEAQHWMTIGLVTVVVAWLLYREYKSRQRAGQRVGPPVLLEPEAEPLPPDDLHAPGAAPPRPVTPPPVDVDVDVVPPPVVMMIAAPDPPEPILLEAAPEPPEAVEPGPPLASKPAP
ncbi:MAG TPA: DedA family protein [Isosphaeraceae bacterium]